jgi:hypothetical protein
VVLNYRGETMLNKRIETAVDELYAALKEAKEIDKTRYKAIVFIHDTTDGHTASAGMGTVPELMSMLKKMAEQIMVKSIGSMSPAQVGLEEADLHRILHEECDTDCEHCDPKKKEAVHEKVRTRLAEVMKNKPKVDDPGFNNLN